MSCFNFVVDAFESDIDCGGPDCYMRCEVGFYCNDDLDCLSNYCRDNICIPSDMFEARVLAASGAAVADAPAAANAPSPSPDPEYTDLSVELVLFAILIAVIVLSARLFEMKFMRQRERSEILSSIKPLLEMKDRHSGNA